jgi:hypothetical protein
MLIKPASHIILLAIKCHPERSEGSHPLVTEILRCAQDDMFGLGEGPKAVALDNLLTPTLALLAGLHM